MEKTALLSPQESNKKNETSLWKRDENLELTSKLIKIGKSLSLETSIKKVFKIILDELMEVTCADKGVIYITSEDQKKLEYERVKIISQNLEMDSENASRQFRDIDLFQPASGDAVMNSLATFVYHTGFEAHFDDVYEQDYFEIDLIKAMDIRDNYRSQSMIALPLVDHEDKVLGIIELTNSKDGEGNLVPFTEEYIDILLSVSSQAAITLSNKMLIRSLEKMIFDFTQAIAYAIDLKSDKSYQHVQNVAHLTNLLAREVNLVDQGALAHREFSRDELDEIAISGWLHDLGKIATPHNLLNKNTKLQKNCDRINHIKIKFDLVEQVIINQLASDLPANRKAELKKILEQLPADFELITQLNPGKEFVSDEIIEQLYRIANVKIEVNNSEYKLLDADELENLLIRRGTLTASEYEEVKQHAQLTSSILSNINFPGKFRNVPQIASSHHERINGSGYPLGLKENEISLQSRILAIADIFDALMSKRSYKQGYQLKTSLNILAKMAAANEIDKDLMDIILDRKIYLTFAGLYDGELSSDINTEDIKKIYRGN